MASEELNVEKTKSNYFDNIELVPKQKLLVLLVGIGLFFDFMDNAVFTIVAPILTKNWHLTLAEIGYINAAFLAGMFSGGLLGGWFLSNHWGRRNTILVSILVFSLSSIFNGLSNGFSTFITFRFFTGLGAASLIVVSNLYLVEMLPSKSRGKWQAITFGLGVISLPFLGILNKNIVGLGDDSWRYLFFIGGTGIISFFLGLIWIKESPRWLVSKGRVQEAETIIKSIVGHSTNILESADQNAKSFSFIDSIKLLYSSKYIKTTLVVTTIFWIAYPAYTIVLTWLPVFFSQNGNSLEDTATFSVVIAIGLSLASFLASFVSDWGGRKWTIVILYVLLSIISFIYGQLDEKPLVLIAAAIYVLVDQSTNPITSTYLAELYPTHLRSVAVGFVYSISRIFMGALQLLIAPIVEGFGQVGVFNILGLIFIIPVIVVGFWGVRTSGKSLELID